MGRVSGIRDATAVDAAAICRIYNQAIEDKLLARSGWEADGYRLFTISVFGGSSSGGWF